MFTGFLPVAIEVLVDRHSILISIRVCRSGLEAGGRGREGAGGVSEHAQARASEREGEEVELEREGGWGRR